MNRRDFLKLGGKSALGVGLLAKFRLDWQDIEEAQEAHDAIQLGEQRTDDVEFAKKLISETYFPVSTTAAYVCDEKISKELLIDLDYAERFRIKAPVVVWLPSDDD